VVLDNLGLDNEVISHSDKLENVFDSTHNKKNVLQEISNIVKAFLSKEITEEVTLKKLAKFNPKNGEGILFAYIEALYVIIYFSDKGQSEICTKYLGISKSNPARLGISPKTDKDEYYYNENKKYAIPLWIKNKHERYFIENINKMTAQTSYDKIIIFNDIFGVISSNKSRRSESIKVILSTYGMDDYEKKFIIMCQDGTDNIMKQVENALYCIFSPQENNYFYRIHIIKELINENRDMLKQINGSNLKDIIDTFNDYLKSNDAVEKKQILEDLMAFFEEYLEFGNSIMKQCSFESYLNELKIQIGIVFNSSFEKEGNPFEYESKRGIMVLKYCDTEKIRPLCGFMMQYIEAGLKGYRPEVKDINSEVSTVNRYIKNLNGIEIRNISMYEAFFEAEADRVKRKYSLQTTEKTDSGTILYFNIKDARNMRKLANVFKESKVKSIISLGTQLNNYDDYDIEDATYSDTEYLISELCGKQLPCKTSLWDNLEDYDFWLDIMVSNFLQPLKKTIDDVYEEMPKCQKIIKRRK